MVTHEATIEAGSERAEVTMRCVFGVDIVCAVDAADAVGVAARRSVVSRARQGHARRGVPRRPARSGAESRKILWRGLV